MKTEPMWTVEEERMERQLESATNKLDRRFMNGEMNQEEYDIAIKALHATFK